MAPSASASAADSISYTIPEHFDATEIEDHTNPYPRPLFLVPLPPLPCQQLSPSSGGDGKDEGDGQDGSHSRVFGNVDILAYGGDDGIVYILPSANDAAATGNDKSKRPIVVRRYDDAVKAIAVSPDALRVSIGFDDGTTKIFSYDDFNVVGAPEGGEPSEGGEVGVHHPFIPRKALSNASNDDDEGEDDEEGGILSQAVDGLSQSQDPGEGGSLGVVEFDGPRMDASIRQMAFDPRSGSANKGGKKSYYLAIVSEDANKPLAIVDATNESTVQTMYLDDKSSDEYDGGGVRSVAYTALPSPTTGGEYNVLLATLGMDGKLVTWDVTSLADPSLFWDVCHKDYNAVVPRKDEGEMGQTDSADKACRVVWSDYSSVDGSKKAVLFMPGRNEIQYRMCPLSKSSLVDGRAREEALATGECKDHLKGPPKFITDEGGNGHKDAIVAIAVEPASTNGKQAETTTRLVTGGRDGRVLLWNLDLEESTGCAHEIKLQRGAGTVGIPPITSIVWKRDDVLFVAFADGSVIAASVGDVEGGASKEGKKGLQEAGEEVDEVGEHATRPVDKAADSDYEEEEVPAKKAKKTSKMSSVIDSDDEDEFNGKDIAAKTTASASPSKKDDKADEDKDASKKKKWKDVSEFIDDEADDGDDDDDIQYDDVVETTNKSSEENGNDADKPAEDNANGGKEGDDVDEDMFDTHNDPLEFNEPTTTGATSNYANLPPPQPAFAPSSTPLGEPRRILCWNHVGVVTLRSDVTDEDDGAADSSNNLVDIAFHETAGLVGGRRPITFTDNMGFIVGTLGEQGGMFASDLLEDNDSDDEDEDFEMEGLGLMSDVARRAVKRSKKRKGGGAKGSSIYFHRFETFGRAADKDWVVALPDGERVLGCATGSGWGGVITNRRFLRLFTISGIQGPVIWIPGEPVTIVGRDRFVAVFYHRSVAPMQDGTQLLGYTILDGVTGATVTSGEVGALSPGSELRWAGFSDKCALSTMDSDGMLSMLARYPTSSNAGNWMPMLDTVGLKKSMSDMFWPVEVHGGKLVCVPLRGGKEHPDAGRRPVTTTLNLRMPMATGLTVKSGPQEEQSVRAIFALNQEKVLNDYLLSQEGDANVDEIEAEYNHMCNQVDKATLRLFSSIVQAGKVERGFDLVTRLHSEKAYDTAIQMSDRVGQRKLADRIEEAKLQRYPPLDEEEGFDDDARSLNSERSDERSSRSFDDEPVIATRQQRMEMLSQEISPEGGIQTPRQKNRRSHDNAEESVGGDYSTDEESPPRESLKRKFEQDGSAAPTTSKKRINPFAKKILESPGKDLKKVQSPAKLTLSRASTFSAKSRQKQRSGKQIV